MNRVGKIALILLTLMLAAGYVYRFLEDTKLNKYREFGMYGKEEWTTGVMRWTWKRARVAANATDDILGIEVYNHPAMKAGPAGTPIKIIFDGKELETIFLQKDVFRGLYYYLPGIKGNQTALEFELDDVFVPRESGKGDDSRHLGIAVSPLRFFNIMPPDGIGFYSLEQWNEKLPNREDMENIKVRWSGKRASLPAGQIVSKGNALYVKCLHPDCSGKPIVLTMLKDASFWSETVFSDHEWKEVRLDQDEFGPGTIITFIISRTWNPKALGLSEDSRDLGLAFAFSWE